MPVRSITLMHRLYINFKSVAGLSVVGNNINATILHFRNSRNHSYVLSMDWNCETRVIVVLRGVSVGRVYFVFN